MSNTRIKPEYPLLDEMKYYLHKLNSGDGVANISAPLLLSWVEKVSELEARLAKEDKEIHFRRNDADFI